MRMKQTSFSFEETIFGDSMNGVGKFVEKFHFQRIVSKTTTTTTGGSLS